MTKESEQEVEWFPMTHRVTERPLGNTFSAPDIDGRWAERGLETWRRGPGEWTAYWPPEDSALAPRLAWTDRHQQLLLDAQNRAMAEYLEAGEEYRISWPPAGNLASEGWAEEAEHVLCSEHDTDYSDVCDECDEVQSESTDGLIQPAEWEWYVDIEVWEPAGKNAMALRDTQRWHFMVTEMDPRDVEYRYQ